MYKLNNVVEQMLKELAKEGRYVAKRNLPIQKYLEEMITTLYTQR